MRQDFTVKLTLVVRADGTCAYEAGIIEPEQLDAETRAAIDAVVPVAKRGADRLLRAVTVAVRGRAVPSRMQARPVRPVIFDGRGGRA
jgi:hypothetical protein